MPSRRALPNRAHTPLYLYRFALARHVHLHAVFQRLRQIHRIGVRLTAETTRRLHRIIYPTSTRYPHHPRFLYRSRYVHDYLTALSRW